MRLFNGIVCIIIFLICYTIIENNIHTIFPDDPLLGGSLLLGGIALLLICAFFGWLPGMRNKSKKAEGGMQTDNSPISVLIKVLGVSFVLICPFGAVAFSMSRFGPPPLSYHLLLFSLLGLFITGAGLVNLKRWSMYLARVSIPFAFAALLFDQQFMNWQGIVFLTLFLVPIYVALFLPVIKKEFS